MIELQAPPFPGVAEAVDGTAAIVAAETAASEAAGAYPITPATQMGEGWAAAAADGKTNVFGRRLLFFEPEGEHAAAAVTAGMSMVGLRAANFSAGQGIAYMHESLYAAVGKRLTYVLNVACRAMTKHSLNIHAGHDDYHAVDDTGFFQVFAKSAQEAADLNLIAHKVAELSLNPGMCAQDGFLTSHAIETVHMPEPELVHRYLGDPADLIDTPTPAQRMVYGDRRRRIPELFDMDNPTMLGTVQNQDSYAQGVAAQRPYYFDHIPEITDAAMAEFAELTGRRYARVSGYLTDDADYVVLAQGSLVWNLEALADWLRQTRGLKIGVVNLTMFRPFPADLLTRLLQGKRAVTILERVDQPLAADLPLAREVRAVLGKALENGRSDATAYPELAAYQPEEVPDVYTGVFGLGSRDTQPGDLLAAVENMLPDGKQKRLYYLGLDFVRAGSELPGVKELHETLTRHYPHVAELALPRAQNVNLMPTDALSVRMHSVGGWGAITTGKNLALTLFELLGLNVKANPKYGSEKKGQPTTFYATFSREPIRLNCDLAHVHVVMSPDPNVFRHSNPLAGLADGGVFIVQSDEAPELFWERLPASARTTLKKRRIQLFTLDGFRIAREEASDPEFQYRMQGAAFQGAFFKASPLMAREGLSEEKLFEAMRGQLEQKFGKRGQQVVDDNLRVIRRGWDEVRQLDPQTLPEPTEADPPRQLVAPASFTTADQKRFFDQVGACYASNQEPTADPFAAVSSMPAATSALRDMTGIRFEYPDFLADHCTGCGQCWTQCPDSAIPGLVADLESLVPDRPEGLVEEVRRTLRSEPFHTFATTVARAGRTLAARLDLDRPARAKFEEELQALVHDLEERPLAKTKAFFDVPEGRCPGSGGMLAVTVNPQTCKGCMLCVDVCPDGALVAERQTPEAVERLRRNHAFVDTLPDTPDRFVNVRDYDEGIGVLNTLLLKREAYRTMVGGDGSCMGCGEKTAVHLVISAIEAAMQPRVAAFVERLDGTIRQLDQKARLLLVADADLGDFETSAPDHLDVAVSPATRERLQRVTGLLKQLKDLKRRYEDGRASLGICNSTGCSSVWAGSYPYNPYPYPWVNHLFQDSPSIAIGVFEGCMRKMADGFAAVRKADLEIRDGWNPAEHVPFFEAFDWQQFDDSEFKLCPPIVSVGGDGAMFDIGFQNLSRLLVSGKPIRVVVLDTQVYSNTGGQACTSGFTGQISDMAVYGKATHGKVETRKELGLIAIAHRGAFVLQSSQANASHLVSGILKGLASHRPSLFVLHTPCMPEHGISDDSSYRTSKLALEGRATPYLTYDPDAGETMAERLDLSGNPAVEDTWPTYRLAYLDAAGAEQSMDLPVTTADWALAERRFARHFRPLKATEPGVPLHEYLELQDREGKTPFLYTLDADRRLGRVRVSPEVVLLTEERRGYWRLLKELAGLQASEKVRDLVAAELETSFEERLEGLRAAHEGALDEMRTSYPETVARRLSEVLVKGTAELPKANGTPKPQPQPQPPSQPQPRPQETVVAEAPWIDGGLCTACDECMKVNPKMFAYDGDRHAIIADPRAGSFRDLVTAAERCSSGAIHPGSPLNPKERDLDKWLARAQPFL